MQIYVSKSQVKHLLEQFQCILGPFDGVTFSSRIGIDLPVVSALKGFVTEEMDCLVIDAGELLGRVSFCFDMLQTVSLVPAMREYIEGDLTADRVARSASATVSVDGVTERQT